MSTRVAQTGMILVLLGSAALASTEREGLFVLASGLAPPLSTCATPEELESLILESRPAVPLTQLPSPPQSVPEDGCTVAIWRVESGDTYLSVSGGLTGRIQRWIGPLPVGAVVELPPS